MYQENEIYKKVKRFLDGDNIFSILKIESKEIRHTNMLEWILQLNNYECFKYLIKYYYSSIETQEITDLVIYNNKRFKDIFEGCLDEKMPDLLIKYNYNNKYNYILIENKIEAKEEMYDNNILQTEHYYNIMEDIKSKSDDIDKIDYILLDANGNEAKNKNFKNMDYNFLYREVLSKITLDDLSIEQKNIYNQYIDSLKRPLFEETKNIKTISDSDEIYLIDDNEIGEFETFYDEFKDKIKDEVNNDYCLKYIVLCIAKRNSDKVNDIIKRKQSQWKYNGCSMSKTSIMENILKDLFFKNEKKFNSIKDNDDYEVHGDYLLIDNLEKFVDDNKDWKKYLNERNESLEQYYNEFKINNKTYYYRNYFVDKTFASIIKKLNIDIDENKREITY